MTQLFSKQGFLGKWSIHIYTWRKFRLKFQAAKKRLEKNLETQASSLGFILLLEFIL